VISFLVPAADALHWDYRVEKLQRGCIVKSLEIMPTPIPFSGSWQLSVEIRFLLAKALV
jgi:hypothetical protein